MNKNILVALSLVAALGLFVYSQSQNEEQPEKKETEPVASSSAVKALLTRFEKQLVTLQVNISQYHIKLERVFFKKRDQGSKTKDAIQKVTTELKNIDMDIMTY